VRNDPVVSLRLGEIVARLGGEIVGAGGTAGQGTASGAELAAIAIARVAPLENAGPGDLCFLTNPKYRAQLRQTRAAAVIMATPLADCPVPAILTPQPYLYYARIAQWLNPPPPAVPGIHPSAVVAGADIAPSASIGAQVWIGAGARIGEKVVIGANCSIGEGTVIGENTRLAANVSVYADCRIGARCILHSGVVIGGDGFGFAREATGAWVKIPQIGRAIIGDDVEIGANTTVDRGALEDTVIGDGVKLDNQIQVAHNVRIGAHSILAGCVGIAGSAVIGERCSIGGAAMIHGHITIVDDVTVTAATYITKSVTRPGTYTGSIPSVEHAAWLKNFVHLRHLDTMADKIRALEQRLAALENKP
jgi:UDP-3-O-[3-hydroxymyristoyl] glucosamine N-acyltransferase